MLSRLWTKWIRPIVASYSNDDPEETCGRDARRPQDARVRTARWFLKRANSKAKRFRLETKTLPTPTTKDDAWVLPRHSVFVRSNPAEAKGAHGCRTRWWPGARVMHSRVRSYAWGGLCGQTQTRRRRQSLSEGRTARLRWGPRETVSRRVRVSPSSPPRVSLYVPEALVSPAVSGTGENGRLGGSVSRRRGVGDGETCYETCRDARCGWRARAGM